MERFLALHSDAVQLTVANHPTQSGKEALAASIGGLWRQLKAMSHSLSGAWSLHEGRMGIAESICMYTRHDDTTYTVRPCTTLRRRDGKIYDVRIHVDVTKL
jgi:SnoaL-like domain